ncbi:MAG TPA: hypothetical protein VKT80_01465 [Chloroflexota bacterium]|nr:hypothetical protein [Chloroflexota bacterium]
MPEQRFREIHTVTRLAVSTKLVGVNAYIDKRVVRRCNVEKLRFIPLFPAKPAGIQLPAKLFCLFTCHKRDFAFRGRLQFSIGNDVETRQLVDVAAVMAAYGPQTGRRGGAGRLREK